jgi:hypothetical protein
MASPGAEWLGGEWADVVVQRAHLASEDVQFTPEMLEQVRDFWIAMAEPVVEYQENQMEGMAAGSGRMRELIEDIRTILADLSDNANIQALNAAIDQIEAALTEYLAEQPGQPGYP